VFASLCAEAGEDVVLWARRPELAEEIATTRRNRAYLDDVAVHPGVRPTADAEEAVADADAVVLAIPSAVLRACLRGWAGFLPREATYVSLVKGIETASRQRASQIVRAELDVPYSHVVVVSGPNLARECAAGLPSAAVAAGPETAVTQRVQRMCHTGWFRVYTNPDVVGVEVGGALKNAIALAAGMADGMGFGDNSKALLITRGLAEMSRLGVALGGNPLTFSGLAGMGDLVATCMSPQSRNRHVGEQIARGRSLDEVVAEMKMVAEGVTSSVALLAIAADHGVELPIVEHVVKVVHEGHDPHEMVAALMGREPKPELHGLEAP
jgi:glycerol-3-phosphate dehydrogenase (NAD(P)+)